MDFSHCGFGIVVSAMSVEGDRGSEHGKKMGRKSQLEFQPETGECFDTSDAYCSIEE